MNSKSSEILFYIVTLAFRVSGVFLKSDGFKNLKREMYFSNSAVYANIKLVFFKVYKNFQTLKVLVIT